MPLSLTALVSLLVYLIDFATYLIFVVPLRSAFNAVRARISADSCDQVGQPLGASHQWKTTHCRRTSSSDNSSLSVPSTKASIREHVRRALNRRALSKAKPSALQRLRLSLTSLVTSSLRVCRRSPLLLVAFCWRLANYCCVYIPQFLAAKLVERIVCLLRRCVRSMRSSSPNALRHSGIDPKEADSKQQVSAAGACKQDTDCSMSHNMIKCNNVARPGVFHQYSPFPISFPYLFLTPAPQAPPSGRLLTPTHPYFLTFYRAVFHSLVLTNLLLTRRACLACVDLG